MNDDKLGQLLGDFNDELKKLNRNYIQLNKGSDVQGQMKERVRRCQLLNSQILDIVQSKRGSNVSALRDDKDTKLINDFNQLNKEFKLLEDKIKKYSPKHSVGYNNKNTTGGGKTDKQIYNDSTSEQTPLLLSQQEQRQEQVGIPQQELDFQTIIEEERSNEILRINHTVKDVNAIFNQLGTMVKQQGENIDTIEDNLMQFNDNTERAQQTLTRAEDDQRKHQRCGTMTLIIVCIVTLLFVIIAIS